MIYTDMNRWILFIRYLLQYSLLFGAMDKSIFFQKLRKVPSPGMSSMLRANVFLQFLRKLEEELLRCSFFGSL